MLNAIEPGSVVPIHRHQKTSETVVVLRGRVVEEYYMMLECGLNLLCWEIATCKVYRKRLPIGSRIFLPQDYAADVYHKVRLEAGTLRLAKYLIRVAVYILAAKVWFFFEMAMASYYSSEGGGCPIGVGHDGK